VLLSVSDAIVRRSLSPSSPSYAWITSSRAALLVAVERSAGVVALVVFLEPHCFHPLMWQRKRAEEALQSARRAGIKRYNNAPAELARANDELRGEIADRQRAEEALQKAQTELAHSPA